MANRPASLSSKYSTRSELGSCSHYAIRTWSASDCWALVKTRSRAQHHTMSGQRSLERIQSVQPADMAAVLSAADALLPEFEQAIAGIPAEERGRGIFLSEMFLFYCVVRPMQPARILESGRDLGGSTLNLAHCFPRARILSVEFEKDSPHAAVALEKLAPYRNVDCLFGDSRELLPRLVRRGDAVLIDGPKDFRALKLALRLLRSCQPAVVFLHDFSAGTPWRRFLDEHWPGAFFSDDPEFLRRFGWLDGVGEISRPTTFACLPGILPALSATLLVRLIVARAASLAASKTRRLWGG